MDQKSSITQLNQYLRREISLVETYRMALDKLDKASSARRDLEACLQSHRERVMMLQDAIITAGGKPVERSESWGVFAKVFEGGAGILGDEAAVAALEEGEAHGLTDYTADADDLDTAAHLLLAKRLMPEQQRTHERMSGLKKRLSA